MEQYKERILQKDMDVSIQEIAVERPLGKSKQITKGLIKEGMEIWAILILNHITSDNFNNNFNQHVFYLKIMDILKLISIHYLS